MGIMVPLGHSQFEGLLTQYLRHNKPAVGVNKTDAKMNEARWHGYREGLCEAFAQLATAERVRLMTPLLIEEQRKYVEVVSPHLVRGWLNAVERSWADGEFKDVDDDVFFAQMRLQFDEVVTHGGDNWGQTYFGVRKDAILAGLMPPTENDREWLEKEYAAFSNLGDPHKAALAKLGISAP